MFLEHFITSGLNALTSRPKRQPTGIPLGRTPESPHRDVVWPDRYRCEHAVVIGKTGTGKTYFLEQLALHIAERGEGFAFFDFHGDASLSLIARLQRLPQSRGRLVVLDPSHPTMSPGLNVLEAHGNETERFRRVSEISSILRARWGVDAFGARTEELLRNSLYTLASGNCTLADLPRLLTDAPFRARLTGTLEHPDIASYWRDRYEPLSDAMKGAFREPLLNRVTAFLTEPAARHLLSQKDSTIDAAGIMAGKQWLVVRLPKGRLREHAHTLGNLLFAQLQFAAMAREQLPKEARSTFTLICDEVQNLAENDLATLITEGRKFGISVITANQFWEQLPRELRGCLLSAASHIVFRVSTQDGQMLGNELSPRGRHLALELTELGRGEAVARLGAHFLSRFKVPALPHVPPATNSDLADWVAPISRLRTDIEAELRRKSAVEEPVEIPRRVDTGEGEGHYGW